jgi:hypothetical protein
VIKRTKIKLVGCQCVTDNFDNLKLNRIYQQKALMKSESFFIGVFCIITKVTTTQKNNFKFNCRPDGVTSNVFRGFLASLESESCSHATLFYFAF